MKWITSTDIKQWADRRDAQSVLPELVTRLIRATTSNITQIRFPSGDAVHLTGWDGILESSERIYNIDSGLSLWECGTNADPKNKANEDYDKRTKDSLGFERQTATYVFVTPRIWDGAEKWAQEKSSTYVWKKVVVLTAVELEDWLSLCPVVALWFAEHLHRQPLNKVRTIETFWNKWATGPKINLTPDILLGGRETEQQKIYQNLQQPSVSIIQSMAQEESLAFAVACMLRHPQATDLNNKCVIVEDEDILERLIEEYDNLIFIANVGNKNHIYATQKGHRVIYATSIAEVPKVNELISLPEIDREKFIAALKASGIQSEYADQLSKETVRNITILRRRLKFDFTCPEWAKPENIRELIPAILVGRWLDRSEGDKEVIAKLAGEPYDKYSDKLQRWLNSNDSPLVTVDGAWRIISPYDVFVYASNYISANDFFNYANVLNQIAADNDPDAAEKLISTSLRFWENKQCYSGWLKEGIFQSAILISFVCESTTLQTPTHGKIWIDSLIRDILEHSTIEWWYSNKRVLHLIAEASPRCYVDYIQNDLAKNDSIVRRLFVPKSDTIDIFGPGENYTEVLRSLNMLSWEPELLLPVSRILMELSSVENNLNTTDKPINSLQMTYTVWYPQTYATLEQRLEILTGLSKKYPDQIFKLCKSLLNRLDHSVVFSNPIMRWRRFGQAKPRATYDDIISTINHICQLMTGICDLSEEQVCEMLDSADRLPIGEANRKLLFNYIQENKAHIVGSYAITNQIRHTIYRHKLYSDAEWALSPNEMAQWECLLQGIEAKDPIQKYRWIFKDHYLESSEIDRRDHDFPTIYREELKIRSNALREIYDAHGIAGIYKFAQLVECPLIVGETYAHICQQNDFQEIVDIVKQASDSLCQFAKGFFCCYANRFGIQKFIDEIGSLEFSDFEDGIREALTSIPSSKTVWQYVETIPEEARLYYWKHAQIGVCENAVDNIFLINKLNSVHGYDKSIYIIYRTLEKQSIPSQLIIDTILGAASHPDDFGNKFELSEVVIALDKRNDVDTEKLFFIEFIFYTLLKQYGHSADIRLIDELMSHPRSLMDILNFMYLSSDPVEREVELEKATPNSKTFAHLAFDLLWDLRRTPCVDQAYAIDEDNLKKYIQELRELGANAHKLERIDSTIGELLANYPEIEDYPPKAICEIIEDLNNPNVNSGFRTRTFNKRGVTIRPAGEGGSLEKAESLKYKRYADKVRFSYPVIAGIFDNLSAEYQDMSIKEDKRTKIEKMEY